MRNILLPLWILLILFARGTSEGLCACDLIDAGASYPQTSYQLPFREFHANRGCVDNNGFVFVGGNLGVYRFDGRREWTRVTDRKSMLLAHSDGVIYGAGEGLFRFASDGADEAKVVDLTPQLTSLGLPQRRVSSFKLVSSVGSDVFFSQTWFIARISPQADGTDKVSLIKKRDALPANLKFRNVFSVGGRPIVQLEELNNSHATSYGWLNDDNSIAIIDGLHIDDHIVGNVQDTNSRNTSRFTCCGIAHVYNVDAGPIPDTSTADSVKSATPLHLNLKESVTFGELIALPNGKLAIQTHEMGVCIFDRTGTIRDILQIRSDAIQAVFFCDYLGRIWTSEGGMVRRTDYRTDKKFWRSPNERKITSLAASPKVVCLTTETDVFRAEILQSGPDPQLGPFRHCDLETEAYATVKFIGDKGFLCTQDALYVFDANTVDSPPVKIVPWSCSDVIYCPEPDAYYVFSHQRSRPILEMRCLNNEWTTVREFSTNDQAPFDALVCTEGFVWLRLHTADIGSSILKIDPRTGAEVRFDIPIRPFVFEGELYGYAENDFSFVIHESPQDRFVVAKELEDLKQRESLFRLWAKHAVKVVPDSDGGLLFTNQNESLVRIQRDANGTLVAHGVHGESRFAGALWARGSGPTDSGSANGNELRYWTPESIEPDSLVPGRVFMSSLMLSGGTGSSTKTDKQAQELPGWMWFDGDEPLSDGRSIPISRSSLNRGEATINYTTGTLNFNFSFPQTVSPELVYFTTRMLNLDDEWSTPNKVSARQFAALREGNYEFQVKAILPDGQQSEVSSLAITVHPPWFRSKLFYAVISSTLLGLVALFARWRIQLERRQIARLQVEIDERKNIETQLRDSQTELVKRERLRALGEMAARAAHDINNILTPVGIYGYLLKSNIPPSSIPEIGEIIERGVQDASSIVQRIHPLYSRSGTEISETDFSQIIKQVVQLANASLAAHESPKQIEIKVESEAVKFKCSASDVREVLLNLINNAIDSISEKGIIVIRSQVQTGKLVVEVEDNGCGMSEETRRRCMDSFFTTKFDRGSGLGLATTQAIIATYNGSIEVQSTLGKGSLFRMTLPFTTVEEPPVSPIKSLQFTHNRILVVDDILPTRLAVQKLLETMDQTVFCCASHEAMKMLESTEIDILLTDYLMPLLNGFDLCVAVRQRYPKIRRIIMSGFESPGLSEVCHAFLQKPISDSSLRAALAAVQLSPP